MTWIYFEASPVNLHHQGIENFMGQETICLSFVHVFALFCLSESWWACRNLHPLLSHESAWDLRSGAPVYITGLGWCSMTLISPNIKGGFLRVMPERNQAVTGNQSRLQKSKSCRVRKFYIWVFFGGILLWRNDLPLLCFGCLYEKWVVLTLWCPRMIKWDYIH